MTEKYIVLTLVLFLSQTVESQNSVAPNGTEGNSQINGDYSSSASSVNESQVSSYPPTPQSNSWGWLWIPLATILVIVCVVFIFVILCYRTDKDKAVEGSQSSSDKSEGVKSPEDKFPVTSKTEHRSSYDYKLNLKSEFGGKPSTSPSDKSSDSSNKSLIHLKEPTTQNSNESVGQSAMPSKLPTSKIRSALTSKSEPQAAQKSDPLSKQGSQESLKKKDSNQIGGQSQSKSAEGKPQSKSIV